MFENKYLIEDISEFKSAYNCRLNEKYKLKNLEVEKCILPRTQIFGIAHSPWSVLVY